MIPHGWRAMREADLAEVVRISDLVHGELTESFAVCAERLRLFPDGCLMTDGGYAIAHPCRLGRPPALDTLLGALPHPPDAMHLHDVALVAERRGQGLGAAAVAWAMRLASHHGLTRIALVAVHGADRYWTRIGFAPVAAVVAVDSYGADACYMARAVGEG